MLVLARKLDQRRNRLLVQRLLMHNFALVYDIGPIQTYIGVDAQRFRQRLDKIRRPAGRNHRLNAVLL
ncbi:hypothetical protein D3C71_1966100 [compost metagenome]